MRVRTIFTSLSPNLERDDIALAIQLLLRPWQWNTNDANERLEQKFRERFEIPFAYSFACGRTCLTVLLDALELHPDDEVLLQAYTCVAVPNPILWTGARPVYVDCEPRTLTLSFEDLRRKITPRSRVLIIQHTFGQAADLPRILAFAKEHHLFVIEDCAHALGGHFQGKLLGTFGDVSFFSFGRDKVLSSVFGGMLLVQDPVLAERVKKAQRQLPLPRRSWVLQQLLHPLLTGLAKATYDQGIGKILLTFGRKTRLISLPVEPQEKEGKTPHFLHHRLSPPLAELALHQLTKLERFQTHRTALAERYTYALQRSSFILPEPHSESTPAWLRYPIQTPRAEEILFAAKREKIYLGDWYRQAIAPLGVNYKSLCYNECPTAEALARTTINLPTDIHITREDADRLIHFLTRVL